MAKLQWRKDVDCALRLALYTGEIHALTIMLMCMDENIDDKTMEKRRRELRDRLTVRLKVLTTYAEAKTKKGKGYMSSLRPLWKKELVEYMEKSFTDEERIYINSLSGSRHYKRRKDSEEGKGNIVNLQATERRLLTADSMAMMLRAGVTLFCDESAKGNSITDTRNLIDTPIFFRTIDLLVGKEDVHHLKNTRAHGTLYTKAGVYNVLNMGTSNRMIRTLGEMRYQYLVTTTLPAGEQINKLILLARDKYTYDSTCEHYSLALDYIRPETKKGNPVKKINVANTSSLYRDVFYIPETMNGIRQLRLLTVPGIWESLAERLGVETKPFFAYDGKIYEKDGVEKICCNFLTGNLNSLVRTLSAPAIYHKVVYAFPWQKVFLDQALTEMGIVNKRGQFQHGNHAEIVLLDITEIEEGFALPKVESFYRQKGESCE